MRKRPYAAKVRLPLQPADPIHYKVQHMQHGSTRQDLTVVESALLQATGATCVQAEEVMLSAHLRYHTASLCSGR
jgi:hypothetical protein